jgi:tetratricopeptide (TPR) repeat protein
MAGTLGDGSGSELEAEATLTDMATLPGLLEQCRAQVQAGQFSPASELASQALLLQPDHQEALYLLAVCQRYLKDYETALQTLAQLQALDPTYGRAWQEAAYCQLALGQSGVALEAFKQAVSRNNSLLGSWQGIAQLALQTEDADWQTRAQDQSRRLTALPPALLSVRNMLSEGKWFKAEQLCRRFLREHPRHVEGMRLLADLAVKSEVLDDAEFILQSAVTFEPQNALARFDYMTVLYRRQKYADALAQATQLRASHPGDPTYAAAYANQCVAVGNFDEALAIYNEVAQQLPEAAPIHLLQGHALKTIGRTSDAITAYQRAYSLRPDFGDAYWSLANLKTYRFSASEIAAMQQHVQADTTLIEDRAHLSFALGKAFEDSADYATSFDYYNQGNLARKQQLRFDSEQLTRRLHLQQVHCTPELFAQHVGQGCQAPDPIFIVGLPRAGSTLLEQILASHSQVDGTLELPNIAALAHRLDGRRMQDDEPRYPARLTELTPQQLQKFGEAYISETQIHRQGAAYFIDKMPNNFRHIGLIQLILPNAKIIDARREPMACCFSGFKQLFASGQEFTYGLAEIGHYYRDYVDLMAHWDKVLPNKVLRVQYEDVVADTEQQVRRLLDFCGLPFEQACLDFHANERSVRTPSAEQVRQPIYQSGLAQWRHFEPWLEPLKTALGPLLGPETAVTAASA